MPTTPIAIETCTIVDSAHGGTCIIKSGLSQNVKVCEGKVCLDGLVVTVAGGTIPGPQVAPVDVTINAAIIQGTTVEGKCPLALGEVSSGLEQGQYQDGPSTQTLPIVLTIADAGQTFVKAQ